MNNPDDKIDRPELFHLHQKEVLGMNAVLVWFTRSSRLYVQEEKAVIAQPIDQGEPRWSFKREAGNLWATNVTKSQ